MIFVTALRSLGFCWIRSHSAIGDTWPAVTLLVNPGAGREDQAKLRHQIKSALFPLVERVVRHGEALQR